MFEKAEQWGEDPQVENPAGRFFLKQIASRIGFVVAGALFVLTRTIDTIFGLFLAAGAIAKGGKDRAWNHHAYVNLKLPAVLGDIVICLRKAVNPTATPVSLDYSSASSSSRVLRDEEYSQLVS